MNSELNWKLTSKLNPKLNLKLNSDINLNRLTWIYLNCLLELFDLRSSTWDKFNDKRSALPSDYYLSKCNQNLTIFNILSLTTFRVWILTLRANYNLLHTSDLPGQSHRNHHRSRGIFNPHWYYDRASILFLTYSILILHQPYHAI